MQERLPLTDPADAPPPPLSPFGWRHVVALLAASCNALCYADRANLSIAIVKMSEELSWDDALRGQLLAAFFLGYLWTQLPGGLLANSLGAKEVLLCGVLGWSSLTLATPACAHASVGALYAARVAIGLFEGVTVPAVHALVAAWAPPLERSRMVAFTSSGQFVGTVAAFSFSKRVDAYWPSIFFVFGGAGFVWAALMAALATSRPATHPCLSAAERAAIGAHAAPPPGQLCAQVPWARLLASPPFLCICAAHFSHNWGAYLLLSWIPQYLSHLGLSLKQGGALYALPFVCAALLDNAGAWVADALLLQRLRLSLRATRKAMQAVAMLVPMACLCALAVTSDPYVALALLCAAVSFASLSHSGYSANIIDIAPQLAGSLMGVVNTIGTIPGVLANWLAGYILAQPGGTWGHVFMIAVLVYAAGLAAFLRYAQGREVLQPVQTCKDPVALSVAR
ncbi:hypothetical protein AB1Y20_006940 [Prymnesium parvum]|uniref:Major facilitator superfamily (MFS) profile domain-containing protein n=1 Tax=Prymnesium parvum TaxID=97485 RepID=A0AB34J150_PRYPA